MISVRTECSEHAKWTLIYVLVYARQNCMLAVPKWCKDTFLNVANGINSIHEDCTYFDDSIYSISI